MSLILNGGPYVEKALKSVHLCPSPAATHLRSRSREGCFFLGAYELLLLDHISDVLVKNEWH